MSLDVDQKRAMAIMGMVEMAKDHESKGETDPAAGFYEEAARLMEAHAENAPSEAEQAERVAEAQGYRDRARALREGGLAPPVASRAAGGWEVHVGGETPPDAAGGAAWEPFGLAFRPGDPAPVIGWRRPASS